MDPLLIWDKQKCRFQQEKAAVGVKIHMHWAIMMISGVLKANLQAFHEHSIIVFEFFLNTEKFVPTCLSVITLLKESKVEWSYLRKVIHEKTV